MKVIYDHSAFNQRFGGVPRYFCELVKCLSSKGLQIQVRVYISRNLYVLAVKNLWLKLPNFRAKGAPRLEQFIGDILLTLSLVLDRKMNVYHATHYSSFMFPLLPSKTKTVVTIFDMNQWVIPDFYSTRNRRKMKQQAKVMLEADALIAISENTRSDITRFFPEYKSKTFVVPLGVDQSFLSPGTRVDIKFSSFVLFVGARNPYKNFNLVIQAISSIQHLFPNLGLVIAGAPLNDVELAFVSENGLLEKIECVEACDRSLAWLYQNAELFVFPSHYEGFGLPSLEAMVSGCPVVASKIPVFEEVCQDAAIYFDPRESVQCARAIELVLTDESVRSALIRFGRRRAAEFTWVRCAEAHLNIYRSIVGNHGRS